MSEDLPARADVVVVGAGLSGLAVGAFLAEGGAEVLVLERGAPFGGASGASLGLVTAGLLDPPHRLVHGLGEAATRSVLRFSQENSALLKALGVGTWAGSLHAAMGEREAAEVEAAVATSVSLGLPTALWDAAAVNEALGGTGFGPGRFVPGDGLVSPEALERALTARALAAGVRIVSGVSVTDVSDDSTVWAGERAVQSEMVVYAAGAGAMVEPWFEGKVFPVRGQALEVGSVSDVRWPFGWRAQQGYLYGAPSAAGGVVGGARWATPHLEVGETEPVVSEAVDAKLQAFVQSSFPALTEGVVRRWAGIMAFTCDGLPFVGGIPGQPRKLACLGFNARGLSLALRSARAVADAALTGAADGLPDCFRPGRMAV